MAGAICAGGPAGVSFITPSEYDKGLTMIRLLVLDVDGTMTDGGVYYDSTGNELKKLPSRTAPGWCWPARQGIRVMICTGRECEAVRRRAADLHIHLSVPERPPQGGLFAAGLLPNTALTTRG